MKKSSLIITLFLLILTLTPALAQAPEGEEYIVRAGDSLSAIAAAEYGNPQAFQAIVAATNAKAAEDDSFAVIDDPAAIIAGQKLWLPADPDLTGPAAPAPAPGERITATIELTTNPWLWISFTDPLEQFDLDNPDNYTITFNPDGTVNVKADCNNASGTYSADDNGTLTIELGPMTLAACPPDSRSDEFVQNLGFVRNFFFENGILYLDMMADGGTFQLASAPESLPPAPTLGIDALKNATYSGIYDDEGPITLTDGLYEGEPFVEGGASRPRVEYINGSERFGDLDGDGVDDAVVFLVESSGGTGNFVYVAAQLNQNGQPVDAGAVWIEDRIQIKSAAIENGQVMLEIITEGPGDAACCKSHKARKSYALQSGQLTEIAGEPGDLERISAADLNGTAWTLVDFNVDQQPVLPDTEVTLSFEKGQISGSGGCNSYNSSFSLGEDNPSVMQIGPVVATRMACPEPVLNQETTYLAALENVSQWYYQVGRLALFYANEDSTTGRLIFEPQTVAEAAPASSATFGQAWEPVACDTFDIPAPVAAQADCGYVTVPEFHSQPAGPTIQVAVVRIRSIGENPAPDPLFMEQGGPGGSSVEIFPTAISFPNMQTLLNSRDLVFVEQRGTLYSRPSMLCPEQTPHDVAVAQGLEDEHDLSYIQACHDRLQAEGVNFDAFNSVENAADLYFVAETLGYDSFNYYGVSYGTLLGQYVIAQAEEHPVQLRSVIIDAVVAPDVDFNAISGTTGSYALRNLFAECAQDETCSQDFPNLENVFLALVDQLNEQPVPITLTVSEKVREAVPDAPETIEKMLDGEDLVDVVFHNLYQTESGQVLPRNIYNTVQNNDFTWIEEVLSQALEPGTTARAMYFTMLCSRQNSLVNEGAFFGEPYTQLAFYNNPQDFTQGCEIMTVAAENPDPFAYDNTEIPTLILNGTHDPITPRPYGEYVGSKLENAYVYTFPGLGHGAMLTAESCPGDISVSFMTDPGQAPDSSCLSQVQPIFLSYPTPLAELTLEARTLDNGVTLDLPSQWALNRTQGLYMDPNTPTSISNGAAQIQVLAGQSVEEALTTVGVAEAEELASGQTIGTYVWTIREKRNPNSTLRYALAEVPEADGTVVILLAATPDTYDDVIAMLWEPILSNVSFTAAE